MKTTIENQVAAIVDTHEIKSVTVIKPREFTPKRGIKSVEMTIADTSVQYKPHHQKALILELLEEAPDHTMSLADMVAKVEADEKLWSRLNSKQSVFNCISYHMKDFGKLGVLKIKD